MTLPFDVACVEMRRDVSATVVSMSAPHVHCEWIVVLMTVGPPIRNAQSGTSSFLRRFRPPRAVGLIDIVRESSTGHSVSWPRVKRTFGQHEDNDAGGDGAGVTAAAFDALTPANQVACHELAVVRRRVLTFSSTPRGEASSRLPRTRSGSALDASMTRRVSDGAAPECRYRTPAPGPNRPTQNTGIDAPVKGLLDGDQPGKRPSP